RCPSITVGYYRLALALLAARGRHAVNEATWLLNCALSLEEDNVHLQGGVDLVLRIISDVDTPDLYWTEGFPKSFGDLRALDAAVDLLFTA
ncbi:unnamed protein product, partial [Discosporangium mesarthrocarpum]